MQVIFLSFLCVGVHSNSASAAVGPLETIIEEWETWKLEFRKDYFGDPGEELTRMKIWMEKKAKIERHNKAFLEGKHTYTLRMNLFGDLLPEELLAGYTGHIPIEDSDSAGIKTFKMPKYLADDPPDYFDWRDQGIVTPVKSQGACGSCWAFSAIAALECCATYAAGSDVILSEQNLIDCSGDYGNSGCDGGNVANAFRYIEDNDGVDTEASYPYEAEDDTCSFSPSNVGATVMSFQKVEPGDEEAMRVAIWFGGPVTASLYANPMDNLWYYGDGVFETDQCEGHENNHAILITGWGIDEDSGLDYWIIKNSWSTDWGDEGYIKLKRNAGGMGMCGIAAWVHSVREF